jgi:glycogenin
MGRPDLLYTFTKISLWRQTQYSKIVYLDADMVVLQNLDHLFQLDSPFAAAPDIGWPDAFNSGMMVLTPNMGEFYALQTLAQSGDSFDGADQGLLNQYWQSKPWERLSFTYNCTPSAEYQWEPAYRYHKSNIKAVHFIGSKKPWIEGRKKATDGVYSEMLGKWWSVYDRHYKQVHNTILTYLNLLINVFRPQTMSPESPMPVLRLFSNESLVNRSTCIMVCLLKNDSHLWHQLRLHL